jgi:hypothetical protein
MIWESFRGMGQGGDGTLPDALESIDDFLFIPEDNLVLLHLVAGPEQYIRLLAYLESASADPEILDCVKSGSAGMPDAWAREASGRLPSPVQAWDLYKALQADFREYVRGELSMPDRIVARLIASARDAGTWKHIDRSALDRVVMHVEKNGLLSLDIGVFAGLFANPKLDRAIAENIDKIVIGMFSNGLTFNMALLLICCVQIQAECFAREEIGSLFYILIAIDKASRTAG